MHERMIERCPHAAVDVVCEAPHEKPLARAAALYDEDNRDIESGKHEHILSRPRAAEDVRETLRELPLEIRPRRHADVVDESRKGQENEQARLAAQERNDPDGMLPRRIPR